MSTYIENFFQSSRNRPSIPLPRCRVDNRACLVLVAYTLPNCWLLPKYCHHFRWQHQAITEALAFDGCMYMVPLVRRLLWHGHISTMFSGPIQVKLIQICLHFRYLIIRWCGHPDSRAWVKVNNFYGKFNSKWMGRWCCSWNTRFSTRLAKGFRMSISLPNPRCIAISTHFHTGDFTPKTSDIERPNLTRGPLIE